jgi:hypothetical protein
VSWAVDRPPTAIAALIDRLMTIDAKWFEGRAPLHLSAARQPPNEPWPRPTADKSHTVGFAAAIRSKGEFGNAAIRSPKTRSYPL